MKTARALDFSGSVYETLTASFVQRLKR